MTPLAIASSKTNFTNMVLEVHYEFGLKAIWKKDNNMYVTAIFHL